MTPRRARSIAAALLVSVQSLWAASVVFDSDFGDAKTYQEIPKKEFVSGAIPAGWADESAWAKANCVYSHQTDGATGFLRVVCPDKGKIQFFHRMDEFKERTAFRVSMRARSPSKAPVKFMVQAMGTPRSFASAGVQVTEEWQDYSATLAGGPTDVQNVGFIVYAPGPGTLDIATLKLESIPMSDYVPSTVVPVTRPDNWWLPRHKAMVERMAREKPDFVIMGDSITGAWEKEGKAAWDRDIAPLKACAFGNGGDRVEHLLWRVKDSGLGKDYQPKLVAVLIGVNNLFAADAVDIAAGMKNLIAEIRRMSPTTRVLILGVFPVGAKPDDVRRQLIHDVNAQYATLADNHDVFFIDFGPAFLEPDGSIAKETLFDYVHCTPKGYDTYTQQLLPKVKDILGQ